MTVVFVGVPCLDGKPHAAMVDSLLAEQFVCSQQGVHLLVEWEIGCSLIGDARNRLAKRFLAMRACPAMVFIDADLSWTAGALLRLVRRRRDVVGGTYRAKCDDVHFHVHGAAEKYGALHAVAGLPGGFLKISRRAFGRIRTMAYLGADGTPTQDFFPTGFYRGTYFGEDYGFCRLWRRAGGAVWLDASIRLRHHDGLRCFEGDPAKWLRTRDGAR